jgi:hypothetical protein
VLRLRSGGVAPRREPGSTAAALPPEVQTAIPAEPAREQAAQDAAAALLEVQLGRLARRVLKTRTVDGKLLLPLAAWMQLAEIQHTVRGSRITGRLQPARTPIVIDADSGLARLGNRRLAVDSSDIRTIGGEVYGSLQLLAGLFGVSAGLDPENAALVVYNPEGLPIARRVEREAARSIQAGGDETVAPELIVRGPEQTLPGLAAAYEVRGSSRPGAPTSYDVGVASGVLRGSAVLRAAGSTGTSPELWGSWSRAWPYQRWLTQLRLGDGLSSGPRPQMSRGFSVTNAPISRAVLVEDLPFAGTLPPDWSVEAYRAGRLVGFDSVGASGRYALTLPVRYGENPVDFVAYGPFGEIRTFSRTFRALPSMVPVGALEYAVSAGACRGDACDAGGNLDLRYGASRRAATPGCSRIPMRAWSARPPMRSASSWRARPTSSIGRACAWSPPRVCGSPGTTCPMPITAGRRPSCRRVRRISGRSTAGSCRAAGSGPWSWRHREPVP